jgi:hypothetical protein
LCHTTRTASLPSSAIASIFKPPRRMRLDFAAESRTKSVAGSPGTISSIRANRRRSS